MAGFLPAKRKNYPPIYKGKLANAKLGIPEIKPLDIQSLHDMFCFPDEIPVKIENFEGLGINPSFENIPPTAEVANNSLNFLDMQQASIADLHSTDPPPLKRW